MVRLVWSILVSLIAVGLLASGSAASSMMSEGRFGSVRDDVRLEIHEHQSNGVSQVHEHYQRAEPCRGHDEPRDHSGHRDHHDHHGEHGHHGHHEDSRGGHEGHGAFDECGSSDAHHDHEDDCGSDHEHPCCVGCHDWVLPSKDVIVQMVSLESWIPVGFVAIPLVIDSIAWVEHLELYERCSVRTRPDEERELVGAVVMLN